MTTNGRARRIVRECWQRAHRAYLLSCEMQRHIAEAPEVLRGMYGRTLAKDAARADQWWARGERLAARHGISVRGVSR